MRLNENEGLQFAMFLRKTGIKQSDIAKGIGKSNTLMSSLINGKTSVSYDTWTDIVEFLLNHPYTQKVEEKEINIRTFLQESDNDFALIKNLIGQF
ncbi:hypothetical protein ACI2JA_19690 [Alkalihalobacillus sp. NPDC078783]|uniref:helix-turn-helix transcriptional regulator n=1 Tax=Streptomyces albidoflavus TaxID=1886 RepID=UPI0033E877F7